MSSSGFATVNPATGQQIETFAFFSAAHTEKVVAQAERGFRSFRKTDVPRRARLLSQLAVALRKHKAHLAKTITTEMGKIIAEAEAEGEQAALRNFKFANAVEQEHAALYQKALDNLGRNEAVDYYVCQVCGHTHEGEPAGSCPVCNAAKSAFKKID